MGINADNSGTFADLANRGNGVRQAQFGGSYWYDRGGTAGYAINGQDALVMATADTIASSLPEGRTDNACAFARATLTTSTPTFLRPRCTFDSARSGLPRRQHGRLDEQTNAFFSILRTRGVPVGTPSVSSVIRSSPTKVGRRTPGATFNCRWRTVGVKSETSCFRPALLKPGRCGEQQMVVVHADGLP